MDGPVFYILLALVGGLVLLNLFASYVVFTSYFQVRRRRLYQTLFVWLVPFLGAGLAIYLNWEERFHRRRARQVGNNPHISHGQAIGHAVAANHRGGR